MDKSQARLAGVGVSFVLALIVGAILGFVAPQSAAETDPTPAETSTTPPSATVTPSESTTTPRSTPTRRNVPPAQTSEVPVPDDTPAPEVPEDPPADLPEEPVPDGGGAAPNGPAPGELEPAGGGGAADLVVDPTDVPTGSLTPDSGDELTEATKDRFSETAALVGFLGAFITGLVVVAIASAVRVGDDRTQSPYRAAPAAYRADGPGTTRVMPAVTGQGGAGGGQDRTLLIEALIHLRDRATSNAIGEHIDATLRDVGVTEDSPVGQRFDPAHHEAGGSEPAPDSGSRDIITGVEVTGYRDRDGSVLRAPVVTVYR